MIYTNTDDNSKLINTLDKEFADSTGVTVASGYTSLDILERYRGEFERVSSGGGRSRLMVGMAFYEGLTQKKLDMLGALSAKLKEDSPQNGVYVCTQRRYHGKIYKFTNNELDKYFVGSSNFSRSGVSENIEATVPLVEDQSKQSTDQFIEMLFSDEYCADINLADIVVPGSRKYKERVASTLNELQRYDPESLEIPLTPSFEVSLSRVAEYEKSSLNVYFGKGRWTRSTGKIAPRNWYEIELIAPSSVNSHPDYPRGQFTAYTDNGYIIPMQTQSESSNFKNIRSQGSLRPFGWWVKTKLQDSGALVPLTPVTLETFEHYGKDAIKFYKLSDTRYYLEF